MNTTLHITPRLPPAIDGVGDYCANLWRHWPDPEDRWAFAVPQRKNDPADSTGGDLFNQATSAARYPAVHRFRPTAAGLAAVLQETPAKTVVLHYVSYGFHPRGLPLWLPGAIAEWRERQNVRLVTMFHEMYADSSPLRSAYWIKPWARQILRRLVGLSDQWVTSCEHYFHWLTDEFGADPQRGLRIPIPSNVPRASELAEDRLWPIAFGRKLRVVVFGLPNTRLWALDAHVPLLKSLVEAGLVESILLLGARPHSARGEARTRRHARRIGGQWRELFDLPAEQVADTLADCDIGLVANDPGTLTKSGVFAALATNGVISIIADRGRYAVSAPFNDCVLLNRVDAGPGPLIAELNGVNRMTARRRTTLGVATSELSWSRVATSFRDALMAAGMIAHQEPAVGLEVAPVPRLLRREIRA